MRVVIASIVAIFISGCASGPVFVNEPISQNGLTRIYIYRPFTLYMQGTWPRIEVDGVYLGDLKMDGYVREDVSPGKHTISINGGSYWVWPFKNREFSFTAITNEVQYFRLDTGLGASSVKGESTLVTAGDQFGYNFNPVFEEQALAELSGKKLQFPSEKEVGVSARKEHQADE